MDVWYLRLINLKRTLLHLAGRPWHTEIWFKNFMGLLSIQPIIWLVFVLSFLLLFLILSEKAEVWILVGSWDILLAKTLCTFFFVLVSTLIPSQDPVCARGRIKTHKKDPPPSTSSWSRQEDRRRRLVPLPCNCAWTERPIWHCEVLDLVWTPTQARTGLHCFWVVEVRLDSQSKQWTKKRNEEYERLSSTFCWRLHWCRWWQSTDSSAVQAWFVLSFNFWAEKVR